jgi:hypothetical protein
MALGQSDFVVDVLLLVFDHHLREDVEETLCCDRLAFPKRARNEVGPDAPITERLVAKELEQTEQVLQLRLQE